MARKEVERFVENVIIRGAGISTIVLILLILIFLLKEGLPFLFNYNFIDFIFGSNWYPLSKVFGALPLIFGSVLVTLVAVAVAVPLSLATALFISEIAPPRVRDLIKVFLEILASVPSVVFGFIGIILLGPAIESLFGLTTGLNAFTAGLLLAFMAIPTITSVADGSLQAVPQHLREASLALGANRLQTMLKVTFPAAFSGIFAGTMLGVGRAIGETMTVMMVAGGAAQITSNIFEPVRAMTGTIAAEMGEVIYGDLHYQSLFMLGILLFLITLGINSLSAYVVSRVKARQGQT